MSVIKAKQGSRNMSGVIVLQSMVLVNLFFKNFSYVYLVLILTMVLDYLACFYY